MKVNLHTHTWRCRHATGSDEDYVLAAIKAGYDKLGFSDHNPFPYTGKWAEMDVREMRMYEFDEYCQSVLDLKEKYKNQIQIYLGVEEDAFQPVNRNGFDYVIGSCHYGFCKNA